MGHPVLSWTCPKPPFPGGSAPGQPQATARGVSHPPCTDSNPGRRLRQLAPISALRPRPQSAPTGTRPSSPTSREDLGDGLRQGRLLRHHEHGPHLRPLRRGAAGTRGRSWGAAAPAPEGTEPRSARPPRGTAAPAAEGHGRARFHPSANHTLRPPRRHRGAAEEPPPARLGRAPRLSGRPWPRHCRVTAPEGAGGCTGLRRRGRARDTQA